MATGDQQSSRRGNVAMHYAHTTWMLALAVTAVGVGFATVNMMLADSGMAVLNHHAAPLMTFIGRLTRQA